MHFSKKLHSSRTNIRARSGGGGPLKEGEGHFGNQMTNFSGPQAAKDGKKRKMWKELGNVTHFWPSRHRKF